MAAKLPLKKAALHIPSLTEVAAVLQNGLSKNFKKVSVNVVDCPDLTQKPFMLAAPGLCGNPRVTDVGGVPNLMPLVDLQKRYNLEHVADLVELPSGFLCGAGAGPHHVVGGNCEMIANIRANGAGNGHNNTHICKIPSPDSDNYSLEKLSSTEFALMANLFCCNGDQGKVLEVKASERSGSANYMSCIKSILAEHYGNKPVALGGTFLVEKSKVKTHVMPQEFSKVPLTTDPMVDEWLNFYEMNPPLCCLGYLISHDPGLDLRMEHFHCFSDHGEGGHYHCDTMPGEVEYRGYFNVAEFMYRIDAPLVTHMIGRD